MAMDLFHRKDQNKVYRGIYFIENAEIGTAGNLFFFNFEIGYGWGFISLKRPK